MSKILPLLTLFTLVAAGCGEEEIDGSAIWAQKCTVCHERMPPAMEALRHSGGPCGNVHR